jgi:hypothetical protein
MDFAAATQYLTDWIVKDLSVQHEQLAGLSKCPFARKAYLDGKVGFVLVQADALSEIMAAAEHWDDSREVLVFILSNDLSPDALWSLMDALNQEYMPRDLVFLDDHVAVPEQQLGLSFNNGRYNLLMMQRLSKLDLASRKLKMLGYYKNWTKEYLDQVVTWRSSRT